VTVKNPCPAGCGTLVEYEIDSPRPFCRTAACIEKRERIRKFVKGQSKKSVTTVANEIPHTSKAKLPRSPIPGVIEQGTVSLCDANGDPIVPVFDKDGNKLRAPKPEVFTGFPDAPRCRKHPFSVENCDICKEELRLERLRGYVPKPYVPPAGPTPQPVAEPEVTMQSVSDYLGVQKPQPKPTPRVRRPENNLRYSTELGITQEQILHWLTLDEVLYYEPVKVPAKRLPSRKQIWTRKRKREPKDLTDKDIQEMKAEVARLEDRPSDDGYSPQQRAGLKRKIRNTLLEHERELAATKRRDARKKPEPTQSPEDRERIFGDDEIRQYQEFVALTRFDGKDWRQFETLVILRAVDVGLYKLTPEMAERFSQFKRRTKFSRRDDAPDDAENALILKTGGDQIKGVVISGGIGRRGRDVKLSSFRTGWLKGGGSETDDDNSENSGPDAPDYDSSDDTNE
jgi:hypothetical protein